MDRERDRDRNRYRRDGEIDGQAVEILPTYRFALPS